MIAFDTPAIIAIPVEEPEEEICLRHLTSKGAVVGAPTFVETHRVLEGKVRGSITITPFDAAIFPVAIDAFARFGKGRGRPAQLNFGDCPSYAVANVHALPLLFKGNDFGHTDIVPAYISTP